MVLELAILKVVPGRAAEFETAFLNAKRIIALTPGFLSLELQKCVESPGQYALLVRWQTLEDHTVGFRTSAQYQEWKALLHRFYDPFPVVEHYSLCDSI
jgi:heme-degrading monooxygenase HmoA